MRLYLSSYRFGNKVSRLLQLVGSTRRTALIFNALDFIPEADRPNAVAKDLAALEEIGMRAEELDLRRFFHDSDNLNTLRSLLSKYDAVWVRGGNSFLLRRAMKASAFDAVIAEMLKNDSIVYGGFSAGAIVLAPSLAGLEIVDDPNILAEGYEAEPIFDGLGILPYAIAPHYKSDHPESPAVDRLVEYYHEHSIPFKSLRDGEVLIVDGEPEARN